MTTYREAIYMCLDLIKGMSDDFTYTEDHIAYLLDKFRALLLKQRYGNDPKKHVPYSNYQSLYCTWDNSTGITTLKSNEQIPYMLQIGIPRVITTHTDYYDYRFELVSRERLPFVGNNKFTKMITYCAIDETNHLCLKPKSEWFNDKGDYLGPVECYVVGIFENPREVTDEISFNESSTNHEWDRNIPIEEGLVTTLIELVVKELLGASYRPSDITNNNVDDNANMANFLANNMKSRFQKQLEA